MLTVLVPAHNEGPSIAATIESLLAQTLTPERIVVVADNCTDDTVTIASRYPVTVMQTVDNPHRKSGAMNQAWAAHGADAALIFTMDADTVLMPDTLERLRDTLLADPRRAAVCARYWAQDGTGLAWRLQRLEYARYDDARELRGWKVQVASGAAVMYRADAIRAVAADTGRGVPWDAHSLIEDYGLTLDLKERGWTAAAAPGAHALTDTPATFRALWQQRLRWGRGGMDECRRRGWNPATRRDIASYAVFGVSMLMRLLWLAYLAGLIVLGLPLTYGLLGLVPLGIMWIDRVTSVRSLPDKTWKDRLVVGAILIEDVYGFFLEACALASAYKCLRGSRQAW